MSTKRPAKRNRSRKPAPARKSPARPAATDAVEDVPVDDAPVEDAVEDAPVDAAAAKGSPEAGTEPEPAESTEADETATGATGATAAAAAADAAGKGDGDARPRRRSLAGRLYHGETNVDFVGRRRLWFTLSAVAVLLSVVGLFWKGLNLGIDFEGGTVWVVQAADAEVADARDALGDAGLSGATIQVLDSDEGREIRVEAEPTSADETDNVASSLADLTGVSVDEVDITSVGPTWGEEISEKALRALVVFLVVVTIYIALRFELKMAIPTLVALIHDVLITTGVYAWTGLEVTPATVIAVLTILGYSIYDGIVVFDKVDENSRLVSSTGGLSYAGMVNVSLNQALMRSLNTTITALLPVGSLLVVGSWIMGASTLEEFAVALLIGLFAGAYSSIFLASPLLAVLKEREPRYRDIRNRIAARGGDRDVVAATIAAGGGRVRLPGRPQAAPGGRGKGAAGDDDATTVVAPSGRVIPARPRKKTRR